MNEQDQAGPGRDERPRLRPNRPRKRGYEPRHERVGKKVEEPETKQLATVDEIEEVEVEIDDSDVPLFAWATKKEWTEQFGPEATERDFAPESASTWRTKLRQGAGRAFDSATMREKIAAHQEQRRKDRESIRLSHSEIATAEDARRVLLPVATESPLMRMQREMRERDRSYIDAIGGLDLLMDPKGRQKKTLIDRMYQQKVYEAIMSPLQDGADAAAVVEVAGTMLTLSVLSSDFRKDMFEKKDQLKDAALDKIDGLMQRRRAAALGEATQGTWNPKTARKLKMWQERIERLDDKRAADAREKREGYTGLYDPHTAAAHELALMTNYFRAVREPGADPSRITRNYEEMKTALRRNVADDGVDFDEVTSELRLMVGQRMEYDPQTRVMFQGMSHGRFRKSEATERRLPGRTSTVKVWDGSFESSDGARLPVDGGRFTVRPPMTAEQHQATLTETMVRTMGHALQGDPPNIEAFRDAAAGYVVGQSVARQKLEVPEDLPLGMRKKLDDALVMNGAMLVDGLSGAEVKDTYSFAYLDALKELQGKGYDINAAFEQGFGPRWREGFAEASRDPRKFFDAERARAAYREGRTPDAPEQQAGEKSSPAPEGADRNQEPAVV